MLVPRGAKLSIQCAVDLFEPAGLAKNESNKDLIQDDSQDVNFFSRLNWWSRKLATFQYRDEQADCI